MSMPSVARPHHPVHHPIPHTFSRLVSLAAAALLAAGCGGSSVTGNSNTPPPSSVSFKVNPCSVSGTLQLNVDQAARVDCSNGGTTVTVAGNGASYLVVPEFATDQATDAPVTYSLAAGQAASTDLAPSASLASPAGTGNGTLPAIHPNVRQMAFDAALRARTRRLYAQGAFRYAQQHTGPSLSVAASTTPAVGSVRDFHVLSNIQNANNYQWKRVAARLEYAGSDVLLYVDTLAPKDGFTSTQLQQFGQLFNGTLYGIDTTAFGRTSDIDNNGHVIMLMSPVVNGLSPKSTCQQGFIAGFFDSEDYIPVASDSNSNYGEIFYSIVPDSLGTASCPLTVSDVGFTVPATFLHELEHLISFSQHVVFNNGPEEDGWLDEGMAITAEELGSVYYEKKCPPPSCRTDASQIFPDSAEGFVQGFLYDSYQYALLPDTASVTLHSDSDNGFSWRGGDWLLVRYMADRFGSGVLRRLENTNLTGVANIENATGVGFPSMFSDFGLALYTDSLPGLPRNTAPAADRFVTRNPSQLWARLYAVSGGSSTYPTPRPIQLYPITSDTSSSIMSPGTVSYYRLDTPQNDSTVTIQFSAPGAHALQSVLHPQLAIFHLPSGQ